MNKESLIAVAGVSVNKEKFGYRIYRDLKKDGYNVVPVGIRGGIVDSVEIYQTLFDLPQKPDLVITVTPPAATEKIVEDCIKLKISKIRMQPGSESQEAISKAEIAGMEVTSNVCFMKEYGLW